MTKQSLALIAAGVGLGVAGAVVASRFLTGLLFGVTPGDVTTLLLVTLVLTAGALTASYLPARRALRIDPLAALRAE